MDKCYNLRFLFLESNSGWVPFWLNRLENYYEARQSIFCDEHLLKLPPVAFLQLMRRRPRRGWALHQTRGGLHMRR